MDRRPSVYTYTKYATPLNRFYLDGKRIRSQIPDNPTKTKRRPGRPKALDMEAYHGSDTTSRDSSDGLNYRKIAGGTRGYRGSSWPWCGLPAPSSCGG